VTIRVTAYSTRALNRLGPEPRLFPEYHPLARWAKGLPEEEVLVEELTDAEVEALRVSP
jgi:hypothetical protein